MKFFSITTILLLFTAVHSLAQFARFTKSGVIEYTKTCNTYAIISRTAEQEDIPENKIFLQRAAEQYKKAQPQFKSLKSKLTFSDHICLFVPLDVPEVQINGLFMPMADQNSTTYIDLSADKSISQKKFFEETFLVKDSIRKIKWKITDETREIAGYTCQRANGVVFDSIYVVAFYTDQIPVSGGPESFTGLPGMILGIALPHENITWFATKVTEEDIAPLSINPPKKGKVVNYKELHDALEPALKNAGGYKQIFYKALAL